MNLIKIIQFSASTTFPLLLCFVFLASCSTRMESLHYSKREVEPIVVADTSKKDIWKNSEIMIEIQQSRTKRTLSISGKLYFSDAIIQSFPIIRYFSLDVIILNKSGQIIARAPVGINYFSYEIAEQYYPVKTKLTLPDNSDALTFTYQGEFADYGEKRPDTRHISF